MRTLMALFVVPAAIAALIATTRFLTFLTGDAVSAATLELIAFVTVTALLSHEPRRAESVASEWRAGGRA